MREDSDAGKQKLSSPPAAGSSAGSPSSSVFVDGQLIGLPLESTPNGVAGTAAPMHDCQWPISSVNVMLYECAAQITRVCSDEVLYIGWNAYGIALQLFPAGAYLNCAHPLVGSHDPAPAATANVGHLTQPGG